MKRIAGIFAAVVVAAAALFALFVVLLPRETLKTQIGQQISAWTGREVSLRGEPEISFFPRLSVTLNDVSVGGPADMADAEIVSMDRLTGTIRLAPLIIGRVEIDSFSLVRPVVKLVHDETDHRNWAFDTGAAALQLAFSGDVPLGVFHVEEANRPLRRPHERRQRAVQLGQSDGEMDKRAHAARGGRGGHLARRAIVTFPRSAESPFAFLNGAVTPVEARVESAPVSMIFSGQANNYPLPHLTGALKLSSSSLRRFANWLGSPIGPGSTLGQASLFGTAELRQPGAVGRRCRDYA